MTGQAESGRMKIAWAREHMPVLTRISEEFEREQPLEGHVVGMALHVEAKTAVLVETLRDAGAEVAITGCNPLSTQDDVSAALDAQEDITCHAKYGMDTEGYYEAIERVLERGPDILIDDGGDLIFTLQSDYEDLIPRVRGACEETTTGVHRLKAMERDGALRIPVIAVNDAHTKFLFDNRYGTGQSTWDAIMRTTNLLVAGKNVVVAGFGWVGRGVAMRAGGLGGHVIVTEVDPTRALEARMEGYRVMPMRQAAEIGDVFVTTTGNRDVIRREHFEVMKDGVVLANSGHFNVEIDLEELERMATRTRTVRENIVEYDLNGRRINVLAEGRLVNLAAGDGHPVEVMDMSFANQALCAEYIAENDLEAGMYGVPQSIDEKVARFKLEGMGIEIDELTPEQEEYITGWEHGT